MCNALTKCFKKFCRPEKSTCWLLKKSFLNWFLLFPSMIFWKLTKWLSVVAKLFLRIVWCFKISQRIAWTLRSIFYMYDVLKECLGKILRAKTHISLASEKSNFWHLKSNFRCQKLLFSEANEGTFLARRSFSKHFWSTLRI